MGPLFVLYRVKNEELNIKRSIQSCLDFADKIFVFDDHSTDRTVEIASTFSKVIIVHSPFESTLDERRDKEYIVNLVAQEHPEWCLCLDADESFIDDGAFQIRRVVEKLSKNADRFYNIYFQFLYVWNDKLEIRQDGAYKFFMQPRLWNMPKDLKYYTFKQSGAQSGFHCGWVPMELESAEKFKTKVPVLHWGNNTEEIRRQKYVWYNLKDPNNFREDRYRHILGAGKYFMHSGDEVVLLPASAFWM